MSTKQTAQKPGRSKAGGTTAPCVKRPKSDPGWWLEQPHRLRGLLSLLQEEAAACIIAERFACVGEAGVETGKVLLRRKGLWNPSAARRVT